MITKTQYNIDDTVWIAGIDSKNNALIPGRIIKTFNIDFNNYDPSIVYYVVEVPSSIEPILEIRTWDTISQDCHGPVGGIRSVVNNPIVDKKYLSKVGMYFDDGEVDYEPSEQEILAAIEKSKSVAEHEPLQFKSIKPKRKYYHRKKKS